MKSLDYQFIQRFSNINSPWPAVLLDNNAQLPKTCNASKDDLGVTLAVTCVMIGHY